jgi:hypothetical protein
MMSSPELAVYELLAKELLRRVFAGEDAPSLRAFLVEKVRLLGSDVTVDDEALLRWEESFDWYQALLAQRERDALNPSPNIKLLDWPWASWNSYIDPLEPGLLAVLSAPDGAGKSMIAECVCEHWARRGANVVFVHYELNRSVMLDRRMSRHTGLTRRELRSGTLPAASRAIVDAAVEDMKLWEGRVSYLHTPGWSMERTIERLHQLKAEGLCDVVILDYLEKADASQRQVKLFGANAFQREADNVEQVKNFSEYTGTPTLMLTQFSKSGKAAGGEIDRTAIRGAGEKTEKANIVVLMRREKEGDSYSNLLDVRVDKNTLGRTGAFRQIMEPEYFRIGDVEQIPLADPNW